MYKNVSAALFAGTRNEALSRNNISPPFSAGTIRYLSSLRPHLAIRSLIVQMELLLLLRDDIAKVEAFDECLVSALRLEKCII